jgi:hypothetical protein
MHNRLEEGERGIGIARLVECGEIKTRLQAREITVDRFKALARSAMVCMR